MIASRIAAAPTAVPFTFYAANGRVYASNVKDKLIDLGRLDRQLAQKVAQAPNFFQETPLVLGLDKLAEDAGPLAHPVRPESDLEISDFHTATEYLVMLLEQDVFVQNRVTTAWLDGLIENSVTARRPPTEQTLPRTLSGTRTAAARHLWKELCALVCAVVAEGERQRGHAEALRLSRQSGEDKRPCNHHALFLNFRRWRVTTGESIYGTRCTFCPPSHRPQRLRYR